MHTIGPYTVLRELARGGMGAIYVAEDASKRQVALKVLTITGDPSLVERSAWRPAPQRGCATRT